MDFFFWIIALLLIGMGGFTGYMNWKAYLESRKAKAAFLSTHSDVKTVKVGTLRLWLYGIMFIACLGLAISMMFWTSNGPQATAQSQASQVTIYFGLAIFSFGMIGEALMDAEIFSVPDGFLYESEFIRYKNIRSITPAKGLFKSSFITTIQGSQVKELSVSYKLAQWVDKAWESWKETRKSKYSSRKERRIAARKAKEERLAQIKAKQTQKSNPKKKQSSSKSESQSSDSKAHEEDSQKETKK